MWYALLDMYNDSDSMTWLLHGDLEDIADEVIEQCQNCDPDGELEYYDPDEEPDEDDAYCEGEDYLALVEAVEEEELASKHLKHFSFIFSDCNVEIHCLAKGYKAFKKAFEAYDGKNFSLSELQLPDSIPPKEETAFAEELEDLLFENKYFLGLPDDLKYVTRKE